MAIHGSLYQYTRVEEHFPFCGCRRVRRTPAESSLELFDPGNIHLPPVPPGDPDYPIYISTTPTLPVNRKLTGNDFEHAIWSETINDVCDRCFLNHRFYTPYENGHQYDWSSLDYTRIYRRPCVRRVRRHSCAYVQKSSGVEDFGLDTSLPVQEPLTHNVSHLKPTTLLTGLHLDAEFAYEHTSLDACAACIPKPTSNLAAQALLKSINKLQNDLTARFVVVQRVRSLHFETLRLLSVLGIFRHERELMSSRALECSIADSWVRFADVRAGEEQRRARRWARQARRLYNVRGSGWHVALENAVWDWYIRREGFRGV
ncbi:hypothetical protein EJ04DRAFT_562530 [Polyplosphaeria fusca]|uniref:Uncharacterized protein n=1 Tax=Polyplosphaeria fusca TaxID=682080 RepID=A0A9P4R3R6_9PLEO|nr:hypothetical protein EJ04DRAFT_562530 [Polyplosphaeria fusca]